MRSEYCTIMWNGRENGASEMNHHQPYQTRCVWSGIGKESPIMSSKNCSQLDQLKAALNKKPQELVNRKHKFFHQGNTSLHVSLMARQKLLTASLRSSDSSAIFTRHCIFRFPFISVSTKFT